MRFVRILIVCLVAVLARPAFAQDRCADILTDGTLQHVDLHQRSYYRQVLYSSFASSSYDESKRTRLAGAEVPIGEEVMGSLNYSEDEFHQRQREVRSTFLHDTTQSHAIDFALTSGDPQIVEAWSECMRRQGPTLSMHFDRANATSAYLVIEWNQLQPPYRTRLSSNIALPEGVRVVQNERCLQAGTEIWQGQPCEALLSVPNAFTTFAALANSEGGNARAVLPPRLRLTTERRPFGFIEACADKPTNPGNDGMGPVVAAYRARCPDRLYAEAKRRNADPEYEVRLTDTQISEGWHFDPASAHVSVQAFWGDHLRGNNCDRPPEIQVSPARFHYQYHIESPGNANATEVCAVEPSIDMVRERWIAAE